MLQTSIRIATPADLELIAELFNDYRVFYQQKSDVTLAYNFLKARIVSNESIIIVAENSSNELVGFTQLYPTFSSVSAKHAMILNDLYIKPQFRRQGIARMLINQAIQLSKDKNCAWLSLQTAFDNVEAQSLYKKIGFVQEQFHLLSYSC